MTQTLMGDLFLVNAALDVNDSGVADGKILQWDNASGKLVYVAVPVDATKADKVGGAVDGNFAGLDGSGNLTDSGSKAADFAAAGHNHDGSYSPLGHDHDGDYAALGHNHDSEYTAIVGGAVDGNFAGLDGSGNLTDSGSKAADFAAAGHNHDGSYSPLGHDHDGDYAALGHTHTIDTLSNVTITTPSSGEVLKYNGSVWVNDTIAGSGDVTAAATFDTDNVIIKSDGTSKGVQKTGLTIDDNDKLKYITAYCTEQTLSDGATVTILGNASRNQRVTITDDRTLAIQDMEVGQEVVLRIVQDGTGGHTVTWFGTIKWMTDDGNEPTLRTGAGAIDIFHIYCTSSENYEVTPAGGYLT